MKLTDPSLEAEIYDETGRRGVGLQMNCPVHLGYCGMLRIPFTNPLDGGPAIPLKANGCCWKRTGDTLEVLTLTPSVDVSKYFHPGVLEERVVDGKPTKVRVRVPGSTNCWHGFVTNGEVT